MSKIKRKLGYWLIVLGSKWLTMPEQELGTNDTLIDDMLADTQRVVKGYEQHR